MWWYHLLVRRVDSLRERCETLERTVGAVGSVVCGRRVDALLVERTHYPPVRGWKQYCTTATVNGSPPPPGIVSMAFPAVFCSDSDAHRYWIEVDPDYGKPLLVHTLTTDYGRHRDAKQKMRRRSDFFLWNLQKERPEKKRKKMLNNTPWFIPQ